MNLIYMFKHLRINLNAYYSCYLITNIGNETDIFWYIFSNLNHIGETIQNILLPKYVNDKMIQVSFMYQKFWLLCIKVESKIFSYLRKYFVLRQIKVVISQ